MLRIHRAGKGPGGCGGVGLRLKEQKGPRPASHPWSQRAGNLTWEPSRLPGFECVGQMPSSPLLLLLEGPSHLPLLFSPQPPSYAPKDPWDLEGALECSESAWELSRLPGPEWVRQSPSAPLLLLPPASPDLPGLRPMPLRTHAAWRGLWRARDWSGSSAGSPGLSGPGNHPPLLSHSSQRAPPCLF